MSLLDGTRAQRIRRHSRESLWVVLGQAAALLGTVLGVRLLTELLDPTSYGELALAVTLVTLITQTVLGPLGHGITRFFSVAREQDDLEGFFQAARQLVVTALAMVALILALLIGGLFLLAHPEWIAVTVAAIVYSVLSNCSSILNGIHNAARQRAVVALYQATDAWSRFAIAAVFILLLGATSTVAMIGYVVAALLLFFAQIINFNRTWRSPGSADNAINWEQRIWSFSRPFALFGIFTWAYSASDRWALTLFGETHDVGLYAVLLQLGYYPASLATAIVVQFLAPIFYENAGDARDPERNAAVSSTSWILAKIALWITLASFVLALWLHEAIFSLLAAREYGSVSYLLPWAVMAGGVFAAGQVIALNLMSQMKTNAMVSGQIGTALLGMAFNVAGAYLYGILGIVIAAMTFSISFFFCMAMLSSRLARH